MCVAPGGTGSMLEGLYAGQLSLEDAGWTDGWDGFRTPGPFGQIGQAIGPWVMFSDHFSRTGLIHAEYADNYNSIIQLMSTLD